MPFFSALLAARSSIPKTVLARSLVLAAVKPLPRSGGLVPVPELVAGYSSWARTWLLNLGLVWAGCRVLIFSIQLSLVSF